MGLFNKKDPKEKVTYAEKTAQWFGTTLQSVGTIINESMIAMKFLPEEKKFQISANKGKDVVTIPYERLVNCHIASESQLSATKGVSVGGAIVGGALFGPVGAIIGSQKNKGKVQNTWYMSFQYYDKDGKVQELCFRDIKHDEKQPMLATNIMVP